MEEKRIIPRLYESELDSLLAPGKVLVIYGPRQVGKTTLIRQYLESTSHHYRSEVGDDMAFRQVFQSQDLGSLKDLVDGFDLLVIDEAQRIQDAGVGLKLLVDHVPHLRIIATGSASLDLAAKISEPLTGRKNTRVLYPVSQIELSTTINRHDLTQNLPAYLIYGSYPEVLTTESKASKAERIREIANSYLLRDVLELERIRSSRSLLNLLRLIAFQIGKEVTLSELGAKLSLDYKTVARYLDLLEKSFVILSVGGFSRNLRKEVTRNNRYYFYDNGVRNALINNFNPLDLRDDVGALWENFLVLERIKRNAYTGKVTNNYYWRTYDQKEIDYLEEAGGHLSAFEFTWSLRKKKKKPRAFAEAYPQSTFSVITKENYLDFVLGVN